MLDWDFAGLESLITDRGDEVIHELGVACTCRVDNAFGSAVEHQGRAASRRKINCQACGGTGWIYRNAQVIKGIVTSVDTGRGRKLLEMGYAVPGDCTFSPSLRGPTISDFDRITFKYAIPVSDGQTIVRNAAKIQDNQLVDASLTTLQDKLWYNASCSFWCEDEDGIVYKEDTDFVLSGKRITWGATRPADGTTYTVKYDAYMEWIVYSSPATRFDTDRTLGQRVMLRKWHVAYLNDFKFETPDSRKQAEIEFTTKSSI
jgi:hypothetical protein